MKVVYRRLHNLSSAIRFYLLQLKMQIYILLSTYIDSVNSLHQDGIEPSLIYAHTLNYLEKQKLIFS